MLNKLFLIMNLFLSLDALAFKVIHNSSNLRYSQEIEAFFAISRSLLPEKMINELEAREIQITVEFKNLNEKYDVLKIPVCNNEQNNMPVFTYGMSIINSNHIILEEKFLSYLSENDQTQIDYNCGHKNIFKLAIATFVHEFMHIYDHSLIQTTKYKNQLKNCLNKRSTRRRGHSRNTRKLKNKESHFCKMILREARRKRTLSGSHNFYRINYWKKTLLGQKLNNSSVLGTPDLYEFKNSDESLAVNFEYFLLDENYKCNRPTLYAFFKDKLNHEASAQTNCQSSMFDIVLEDDSLKNINPNRIYQIEYLLGCSGEGLISKYGHAMLRIVVCAPFRIEVNHKCLFDIQDHIVISYAADVGMQSLDPLKGMFGGYNNKIFFSTMPQIIRDYVEVNWRDLKSYPLNLTRNQINTLIGRSIEMQYSYENNYYYLYNNCSDEVLNLLKVAVPRLEYEKTGVLGVVTPTSLVSHFSKNNLIEDKYLQLIESQSRFHYFNLNFQRIKMLSSKYLSTDLLILNDDLKVFLLDLSIDDFKTYIDSSLKIKEKQELSYLLRKIIAIKENKLLVNQSLHLEEKDRSIVNDLIKSIKDKKLFVARTSGAYGIGLRKNIMISSYQIIRIEKELLMFQILEIYQKTIEESLNELNKLKKLTEKL